MGETMIKKEWRDMITRTLATLAILLLVPFCRAFKIPLTTIYYYPVIFWFNILALPTGNDWLMFFIFVYAILLLGMANHYGFSMFAREHKDRAFEYLLALPLSKSRIFLSKLAARLPLLFLLTLIYEALAFWFISKYHPVPGRVFALLDPHFFPVWLLFLFLGGTFLGLFEQKNIMALVTVVTVFSTIIVSLGFHSLISRLWPQLTTAWLRAGAAFSLGVMMVLAVLAIAFIPAYRRFDMKPADMHNKKFAQRVLPPLILLFLTGIMVLAMT